MSDKWMTQQEQKALERAQEQGFLVCRAQQKFLIDEWARRCLSNRQPSLRLETGLGRAQLIVNVADGLSREVQDQLREKLTVWGAPGSTTLLPIVHRFGAYSQHMKMGPAQDAARALGEVLGKSQVHY